MINPTQRSNTKMKCYNTIWIALAIALTANPASARIITVDANGGAQYDNIQDAVLAAAVQGDEIVVEPGVYTGIGDRPAVVMMLGKTILLRSNSGPENTIIDGQGTRAGIWFVTEVAQKSRAIIQGFTIRNGRGTDRENNAGGMNSFGGGIGIVNNSPTIDHCIFRDNTADFGGGVHIGTRGAAGISRPVLQNCTFEGNRALVAGGGLGIFESEPELSNCTFSGNSAEQGGGGIQSTDSPTICAECVFTQNTATWGAGWYDEDSGPELTECEFRNNVAENSGGGFYCIGFDGGVSSPTLQNCTFGDNRAATGGGLETSSSNPRLTGCLFENNTARMWGGGVRIVESELVLSNCTFSGNSAGEVGGGISSWQSPATSTDCVFTRNTAPWGGGWQDEDSISTLTRCQFRNNVAGRNGEGEGGTAGGFNGISFDPQVGSNPTLQNCTFENNRAETQAGGTQFFSSTPELSECSFSGNSAPLGGGILNYQSRTISTDCVFTRNTATWGAGWQDEDSNSRLIRCEFRNNVAQGSGGGFNCISFDPVVGSRPTLQNCIFEDNHAEIRGGGLETQDSTPELSGCTFSGNSAVQGGGALHHLRSPIRSTDCVFTRNMATVGGGAVHASAGIPNILPSFSQSIFCGNRPVHIFPENTWAGQGNQFENLCEFDEADILVAPGDEWDYLTGAEGGPAPEWTTAAFDDFAWRVGPTGIGYGDNDDATVLLDMRNNYVVVYARKVVELELLKNRSLILSCAVDDGFVAYFNGEEIGRFNVTEGAVNNDTTAIGPNLFGEPVTDYPVEFPIPKDLIVQGDNIIAISVHNATLGSSDLTFIPTLIQISIGNGEPDPGPEVGDLFLRGDVDDNGAVNLTDAVALLLYLFQQGREPNCLDSTDIDDDGFLNLTDGIVLLDHLFRGGPAPQPPGFLECGTDPTEDALGDCTSIDCTQAG